MATRFIKLTAEPQQLSDGTKRVHATFQEGSQFYYSVCIDKPNVEACPYHSWKLPIMNIETGFPVWAWDIDADIVNQPVSVTISTDLSEELGIE